MLTSHFDAVARRASGVLRRVGSSSVFTVDSVDDGLMVRFSSSSGAHFDVDWMVSGNLVTVFVNDEFVVDDVDVTTAEAALVRALSILEARWLSR